VSSSSSVASTVVDFVILGAMTSLCREDWSSNPHEDYMLESFLQFLIWGLLRTIQLDDLNC